MEKKKVGIIGATGMVGQRFLTLLDGHPYFEVTALAASARSAGQTYEKAVEGRWKMAVPIPAAVRDMVITDAADIPAMAAKCDFVFCAVNMKKDETKALEEAYARAELPVVSNNSANRWTPDVPMVIPEINDAHLAVIAAQKARLGTRRGFIAVKPNCSIQSYVPALTPLLPFGIEQVVATTYQAISGAGKTFREWPEMVDNVIPFIGGEEEKSEKEPRADCQSFLSAHHNAVHSRSGFGRSHGGGLCKVPREAFARTDSRCLAFLLGQAAVAEASARARAIHHLF